MKRYKLIVVNGNKAKITEYFDLKSVNEAFEEAIKEETTQEAGIIDNEYDCLMKRYPKERLF